MFLFDKHILDMSGEKPWEKPPPIKVKYHPGHCLDLHINQEVGGEAWEFYDSTMYHGKVICQSAMFIFCYVLFSIFACAKFAFFKTSTLKLWRPFIISAPKPSVAYGLVTVTPTCRQFWQVQRGSTEVPGLLMQQLLLVVVMLVVTITGKGEQSKFPRHPAIPPEVNGVLGMFLGSSHTFSGGVWMSTGFAFFQAWFTFLIPQMERSGRTDKSYDDGDVGLLIFILEHCFSVILSVLEEFDVFDQPFKARACYKRYI